MSSEVEQHPRRFRTHLLSVLCVVAAYVLSSGPILGLGFWLREQTGIDAFYAVIWVYFPIVHLRPHTDLLQKYISWWVVDVFHTVGPG